MTITSDTHQSTNLTENTPTPAEIPVTNPLLDRIILPGETFKLPSCGVFYTNGELRTDVQDAEVHVHPMTALDEIVLKTPDLLFSGQAVKQVFARCIPQVMNVEQLLAKDVDFLLLCLRKVSYGPIVKLSNVHDKCPKTLTGIEDAVHEYSVNMSEFITKTKRLDPTTVVKEFSCVLSNDQVVNMQPIRFIDFIKIMQTQDRSEITPEEMVTELVVSLANIILSVDEISDKGMIREWLSKLAPEHLNSINQTMDDSVNWGPDFKYKINCVDCNAAQSLTAPLNPLVFFT